MMSATTSCKTHPEARGGIPVVAGWSQTVWAMGMSSPALGHHVFHEVHQGMSAC